MRNKFDIYVFITITGSIPPAGGLLVPEDIIRPVVSVTITGSIPPAGGLLVPEDIIRPVVSVTITWSIPLLVDY